MNSKHWTGEDDRDLDPARDALLRLRRPRCTRCGNRCQAQFVSVPREGWKRARIFCEQCLRLEETAHEDANGA